MVMLKKIDYGSILFNANATPISAKCSYIQKSLMRDMQDLYLVFPTPCCTPEILKSSSVAHDCVIAME